MGMMNETKSHIFLDTNIWVYCCLASQENFNHSVLVKIRKALDANKFVLLVPETVRAELDARLDEHLKNLRAALSQPAEKLLFLKAYPAYEQKMKNELDRLGEEAKDNFEKSKKQIADIFEHKNTVQLKLTGDMLVQAHLRCLSRKRPFRVTKSKYSDEELSATRITEIQNDALIIEEVKDYLKGQKNYKLLIANRDKDYADPQTNKLHSDIADDFAEAELYEDIQSLLKLFKVEVPPRAQEAEDALNDLSSLPLDHLVDARDASEDPRGISANEWTNPFVELNAGVTRIQQAFGVINGIDVSGLVTASKQLESVKASLAQAGTMARITASLPKVTIANSKIWDALAIVKNATAGLDIKGMTVPNIRATLGEDSGKPSSPGKDAIDS